MTNAKTQEQKETPLMKQYNSFKAKYPGALLLFRVGDFYETFGEDAILASKILGIVLTKRANGSASHIELAGFPHHSVETYLPKLVRAGHRVAICDQLEDPKLTKTIVKRGVTEVISPGVAYKENTLDHKNNNYLCAIHFDKDKLGIAFIDLSTGEFFTSEGNVDYIDKLIQSFKPAEVLYQRSSEQRLKESFGDKFYTYRLDEWVFNYDYSYETLIKHFDTISLKGFGIESMKFGIVAAGACLHYIKEAQHQNLSHISAISRVEEDKYMWLDRFTIRNLELNFSANDGALRLIDVIDATITPMGARTINKWLVMPLKNLKDINDRLDVVEQLINEKGLFSKLAQYIQPIGDLERLISRIALQKASPREINQLARALESIASVKKECDQSAISALQVLSQQLNPIEKLIDLIKKQLQIDPPNNVLKGNVIAAGVDEELDELRRISTGGKDFLLEIQQREALATGINSLKVAFNNVFGYYLEVTNLHKNKVPETWIRKQTLINAERYITPELKVYEEKILGAEEKIIAIEQKIFSDLIAHIAQYIKPVQVNAFLIAKLDALMSLAKIAMENRYVRPELSDGFELEITGGRHPVIEKKLPIGEEYISNDIYLDDSTQQIIVITGPNMSGKSAILRQTGLIVLMAQMGSFVPASRAKIGIVDKIFTRVGASDNISSGESTFMVEMNETASILNNFSNRSLILLDEIGRGTSTYDGISIAWAIAEFLHDSSKAKPKTLFATHYHELNEMSSSFSRIKNFNVSVKELDKKVLFLRKLIPGGSEHSFGIHVAKMAGMPAGVINRANEVLAELEAQRTKTDKPSIDSKNKKNENLQFTMFGIEDPVLIKIRDEINNLEINNLTPVDALMKLNFIQKLLKES